MMRNFAAAMTGLAFVVLALALLIASGVDGSPSDSRSTYHHQDTAKMAYDFGYEHADAHTGNKQGRKETRDGYGNVRGSYNLVEPDGSYRLVEYTADKHNGFVASVKDKHGARTYGQHQHHQGAGAYAGAGAGAGAGGHHQQQQQHHRRHQHADGGHHHHGAY